MSPQEFWAMVDARKPPEKVGPVDRRTFDRLVRKLKDAQSRQNVG